MNKPLDDFAKNLATGMSRRKAFLTFLGGAGAFGFLGARKAKATAVGYPKDPSQCGPFCIEQASLDYVECLNKKNGTFDHCWPIMAGGYTRCLEACQEAY